MSYFLGIDIGTSSAKLTAIDESGAVVGQCGRDYSYDQPHPGWREIWPGVWADAVEDGLAELLAGLDRSEVKAVGFTGQMHTTVFLDRDGTCIRPAVMWNDMRTKELVPSMREAIAGRAVTDAGSVLDILSTGSPAANLLWLREQEPEHFEKLDKFLIGPDYLAYYFSGVCGTDYCEASTSSLYDIRGRRWSRTMQELVGLSGERYPRIRGSQEVVGCITGELSRKFSLPGEVKIIAGTGDNPAAAVATGALSHGYPVLSIGTSGVLVLPRDRVDGGVKGKQILFSADGRKIRVLVQGVVQSAGGSYSWYAKNILGEEEFGRLTENVDFGTLGEGEVLFYPHLTGDKTIYGDPTLRGAFIGLDTNTSRQDLAVAVMEGICFAVKQLIQEMRLTGEELERLKVTGGGSKSRVWMQILADVLNVSIEQLDGGEGASLGAAILARGAVLTKEGAGAVFAGAAGDEAPSETFGRGGGQTARPCGRFAPRPRHVELYEEKYKKYLRIHDALKRISP